MFAAQLNSLNTLKLANAIIPITRFNKGGAGKIIDEVQQEMPLGEEIMKILFIIV